MRKHALPLIAGAALAALAWMLYDAWQGAVAFGWMLQGAWVW